MSEGEKQFGRALAVDDESSILRLISRLLVDSCEVVETLDSGNSSIEDLIEAIRTKLVPNLLLTLDGQYNGGTALDIIKALQVELTTHETHVLVATGASGIADQVRKAFHQVRVLNKPFDIRVFHTTVKSSVPFTI